MQCNEVYCSLVHRTPLQWHAVQWRAVQWRAVQCLRCGAAPEKPSGRHPGRGDLLAVENTSTLSYCPSSFLHLIWPNFPAYKWIGHRVSERLRSLSCRDYSTQETVFHWELILSSIPIKFLLNFKIPNTGS